MNGNFNFWNGGKTLLCFVTLFLWCMLLFPPLFWPDTCQLLNPVAVAN